MDDAQPSTSKGNRSYANKRPLTDAELLEIIEGFTYEDLPEDTQIDTDIESDFEDLYYSEIICNKLDKNSSEKQVETREDTVALEDELENAEEETNFEVEEEVEARVPPKKNRSKKGSKSKKSANEVNRKWKKREVSSSIPTYQYPEGCIEDKFAACETPTDIFIILVDPLLENLVEQSNLYAVQRGKILNINKDELLLFIGLNMLMGYHKLPSWRHFWSTQRDLGVSLVSSSMPRDRFDAILSNLHANDNSQMPRDNKDKLYKLRPMIKTLNETFSSLYNGTRQLSVDESMIIFKGRSSLKQYNPMKPIKRGYKLWCLSYQYGFIKKFQIYEGKDETVKDKYSAYGLGERVVLSLTEDEWGKNRIIYFDNYFTSLPLLEKLKTEQTLACGTIRSDRKGLPNNMTDNKSLKRGDYDYRFSSMDIGVWKWQDNKTVYVGSNFHGSEKTFVKRTQKDGSKLQVAAPVAVEDYNKYMGGVDQADRLRAVYGVNRRSKKWWHRLFWGLIDMAFVNAYVIYSDIREKQSLLDFRRSVALGLITHKRCGTSKRRSSEFTNNDSSKKKRGHGYSITADVRLSNRGAHWVIFADNRGRCEVCSKKGIQSKPLSKCCTCNVSLCCNVTKNCFLEFHQVPNVYKVSNYVN